MPIKSTAGPKKIIYVDWDNREIYTEEEYRQYIANEVDELIEDKYALGEFINDNYDLSSIGEMVLDEHFREQALFDFREWCYNSVVEDRHLERYEV